MRIDRLGRIGLAACGMVCLTGLANGETVEVIASKDNTLIQDANGAVSNGMGPLFFCGRVGIQGGGTIRRAVVAFDLSADVPAGSVVESVEIELSLSQSVTGPHPVSFHRAQQDWGEGASVAIGGIGAPSEPGDATWIHTFFDDQFWDNAGGDFVADASATETVFEPDIYVWDSTDALVADVQSWVDDPDSNFGWVIRGNENIAQTAKGFESREGAFVPKLRVTYSEPQCPAGDLNGDCAVDGADLGLLLGDWGPCRGCDADLNGDNIVNGADLGILLGNWTS